MPWRPIHLLHQKATSSRAKRRFLSIIRSINPKLPLRYSLPAYLYLPTPAIVAFNPSSSSHTRNTFIAPIPSLDSLPTSHHGPYHLPPQPQRHRQGVQQSHLQQHPPPLHHRRQQHRLPMQEARIGGRSPTWRDSVYLAHQDASGQLPKNRPMSYYLDADIHSEEIASPASARLHPQRRLCESGEQPFRLALALAILPGAHGSNVFGLHC